MRVRSAAASSAVSSPRGPRFLWWSDTAPAIRKRGSRARRARGRRATIAPTYRGLPRSSLFSSSYFAMSEMIAVAFRREMLLQVVPEEGQDVLPEDVPYSFDC
jgi:hypothetical protein